YSASESCPVFICAHVLTPLTRRTELVVNQSMRRIHDFETFFADAYRILSVLAEPRGSRSEAGVELTHLVKDCSLKRHIGSRETADFTHFPTIVDDGDGIFT